RLADRHAGRRRPPGPDHRVEAYAVHLSFRAVIVAGLRATPDREAQYSREMGDPIRGAFCALVPFAVNPHPDERGTQKAQMSQKPRPGSWRELWSVRALPTWCEVTW